MFIVWMIFLVIFIYITIKHNDELNPRIWTIISGVFVIGMYLFSGVQYYYDVRATGILYYIFNMILFLLFFKAGTVTKTNMFDKEVKDGWIIKNRRMMSLFGYVGVLLAIFDLVRSNNLLSVAAVLASHDSFDIGVIGVIGSFLYPILLICWLQDLVLIVRGEEKFKIKSLIKILLFFLPNILTSGRQTVLFGLMCSVIACIPLIQKQKKKLANVSSRRKLILICGLVVGLLLVYMGFIATQRNTFENKVLSMLGIFGATMTDSTFILCTKYGIISSFLFEFIMYYSHELPFLQVLIDNYRGPYGIGSYQFHYIFRRFEFLGFNSQRAEIALESLSSSVGVANHTYRTILGSSICDFGLIGTCFFICFLALICGIRYKHYKRTDSIIDRVSMIIICSSILFSIEYSPFRESTIAYSIIWLVCFRFFMRTRIKRQVNH